MSRPREKRETGEQDLFRSRLDQIINMSWCGWRMRRRSAIEPVIGHIKAEHRMGRNYLAGQQGDALNAILAAAGYNFSLLLIAALQSQPNEIEA